MKPAPPGVWPKDITVTAEYEAAWRYLREGTGHLFITGRAGTGKSTLLRSLSRMLSRNLVILAPTGLAAVNAGGQTLHSFFGLPPRLVEARDIRRSRNSPVMNKLDFVVIDEVSMVRADLMWAIDQTLRLNRKRPSLPFGGVRLILSGDLHQLPPVTAEEGVASYLAATFGSPFFFSAPALAEPPGTVRLELGEVFRQRETDLLRVLNRIREGEAGAEDLALLNTRVSPIRTLREGDPYVILAPTNAAVDRINRAYLEALPGSARVYAAETGGEFSPTAQPAEANLALKPGAKVIFLRNDPDRRWVNGTIGRVAHTGETSVTVDTGGEVHEVAAVTWEWRRYMLDKTTNQITEHVAGTFKQLPLRLAWALTIHKSQGLTLDRVYIDFGQGTFAHGQAYVALSRCRTLSGLALARPLVARDIRFNREVLAYRERFPPLPIEG